MPAFARVTVMKIVRFVAALVALAPLAAQAQVRVSLVAADTSAQSGKPLTVALRLKHEPRWHTFWIQAGTGYATSLHWDLPEGWTASEIKWPTPMTIHGADGAVIGNGYEDVAYLPVTLTAPANSRSGDVTLQALAKWLMCSDVCIPAQETVALNLRVSPEEPQRDEAVRAELAKLPMPQGAHGWRLAASRSDQTVTLQFAGKGAIESPHFFSEDAFIQYDQPQAATETGTLVELTLPIAADARAGTRRLVGVLAYRDASGVYQGVHVDVPLSSASPDVAAHGSSATSGRALDGRPGISSAASGDGPPANATPASFLVTLLFAVAGGLVLNLMPCVFPVLGIKIVGFIAQAGGERRRVTLHGLLFTLGVLLSFWALAGALAVLRAGGEQLGWGFQLQSPVFVFGLAVVMLVFALSLSGVFQFGLRATGVGSALQMKEGYAGSVFTGVLATVAATPCSAPFLAPALGVALALPTAQSLIVFTAIAAGLSLPYLLLSMFPGAVKILPRPGRWMETVKQLMAFPLYGTVAYLVWVLAGQTSENGLLMVLLGLTCIALAVWVFGRYAVPGTSRARMHLGLGGAAALFAVAMYVGWPRAAAPMDVVWEPWSTERVAQLRVDGRSIYVDFTARWCATCQANKKIVFGSDEVKRRFHDRRIVALKADWTNDDPRITAELARWKRSSIPFNLVYVPERHEPRVLPEVLTPGIVLSAFGH